MHNIHVCSLSLSDIFANSAHFLYMQLTLFCYCNQSTSIATVFTSLVEKSQLANDNNNNHHEETEEVINDYNQCIKCRKQCERDVKNELLIREST